MLTLAHAPRSVLRAPCSALRAPRSVLRAPRSALHAPRSVLRAPCSTLRAPRSVLRALCSALHAPRSALHAPRSVLRALCSALRAPRSVLRALCYKLRAPRSALEGPLGLSTNAPSLSMETGGDYDIELSSRPCSALFLLFIGTKAEARAYLSAIKGSSGRGNRSELLDAIWSVFDDKEIDVFCGRTFSPPLCVDASLI